MTTINEPLPQLVGYGYNSQNPIIFTIETQTEKNEIISICHLNEKKIALELSDVARKMFKLNRTLFDKINMSTKLIGGKVYREEIKLLKQDKNKLGVKLLDKYEHNDVEIINLDFGLKFMSKRQSILTKNGRRIDFDPTTLGYKEDLGPLDPQKLTFDDVKVSTMVCEIEEIPLFQSTGVKTFMLKDFLDDAPGLYQTAYRIEIKAETEFKEYVEYVLSELEKSIMFLTSYKNSINTPTNYNTNTSEFRKSFRESILLQLGITEDLTSVNLGVDLVKNSQFGTAALNYYNASKLMSASVQKSVYGQIIKSLLPTQMTTPRKINDTVKSFEKIMYTIKKVYNIKDKDSKSSNVASKISSRKNTVKKFVTATTERINIEREALGYNVFSEQQTGLNKLSISSYRQRIGAEQTRYYPSMDVADDTKFMTSVEKSGFMANTNISSYVTPVNLVLGNKRITCSRGMNNMDINAVRQFRMAKSARAIQMQKTLYPSGLANSSFSNNVMGDFNVSVASPVTPILERAVDIEIDPMQDAKNYVGESSFFVTNNPEFILNNFKNLIENIDNRILAIVSDIIPGTFLKQNDSIDSVKELQLSNKTSRLRGLVAEKRINFEEIPPQIKSMMTKSFQNNPDIDPLKNRESRAIIDETQKNIFLVQAHTGFETDSDGFPDLNKPIIQNMDSALDGQPLLAKALNYEVPELGIVKDKFMPTIYNNLLYIGG